VQTGLIWTGPNSKIFKNQNANQTKSKVGELGQEQDRIVKVE
jgi:hypothetical protein